MSTTIYIGFDPATEYIGCCPIWASGEPLPLKPDAPSPWVTFSAHDRDAIARLQDCRPHQSTYRRTIVSDRLMILKNAIWHHLTVQLPLYMGPQRWSVAAFVIENPAQGGVGYHARGGSRFDTVFVLGRAFQMVTDTCREYADWIGASIPILDVEARQSSQAVGCHVRSSKLDRNYASAVLANGQFVYTDEKHPEHGRVQGGALHGANPDTLDAFAAALAGRSAMIDRSLISHAQNQERNHGSLSTGGRRRSSTRSKTTARDHDGNPAA